MGLPRFEKLRNRRQREFESKLLTLATPKPKNRFLTFINAPFTLWFLSAVVLGFGSVYFTAYKQCIIDGTKLSEDYTRRLVVTTRMFLTVGADTRQP
jgi:hypothetical protein